LKAEGNDGLLTRSTTSTKRTVGGTQLGRRDVTVLLDDYGKEAQMRIKLARPFGRTCVAASARPVGRIANSAPAVCESLKRNEVAQPHKPSSI